MGIESIEEHKPRSIQTRLTNALYRLKPPFYATGRGVEYDYSPLDQQQTDQPVSGVPIYNGFEGFNPPQSLDHLKLWLVHDNGTVVSSGSITEFDDKSPAALVITTHMGTAVTDNAGAARFAGGGFSFPDITLNDYTVISVTVATGNAYLLGGVDVYLPFASFDTNARYEYNNESPVVVSTIHPVAYSIQVAKRASGVHTFLVNGVNQTASPTNNSDEIAIYLLGSWLAPADGGIRVFANNISMKELLVFDAALSSGDITTVVNHLNAKYSIF